MKRMCSIWLPALAIERWAKASDCAPDACPEQSRKAPVVLTVEGTHGLLIHAVTRAAAELGARAGARLTDARALDLSLIAVPADPEGDQALLQRFAKWAGRWSPLVEVDGADTLRLDVTGVAHLFDGEDGLIADIGARFEQAGFTARIAIAPTAAAAWALAHYQPLSPLREREGPARFVHAPSPQPLSRRGERGLAEQLAPLHVSALRLDPDTVRTLERLGLKTVGALLDMPRLALARRFRGGEDVVDALDRMVGRKPEPLTAAPNEPPPRATMRLEEPATHPEAAVQALERLIPGLVQQLQQRHLGARRLSLLGYRVDGSIATASVATAIASREPKHLQRLLADKAAMLNPEFGFDAFALVADWTESLDAAQDSLVEEPSGERELARLVDRLTVKLGPRSVRKPEAVESHLPERASGWVSALSSPSPLCGRARSGGRERSRLPASPLSPTPLPRRGEGPARQARGHRRHLRDP
jgi:protein ImuB